jgi:hypothetical protein
MDEELIGGKLIMVNDPFESIRCFHGSSGLPGRLSFGCLSRHKAVVVLLDLKSLRQWRNKKFDRH